MCEADMQAGYLIPDLGKADFFLEVKNSSKNVFNLRPKNELSKLFKVFNFCDMF